MKQKCYICSEVTFPPNLGIWDLAGNPSLCVGGKLRVVDTHEDGFLVFIYYDNRRALPIPAQRKSAEIRNQA